MDKTQPPRQAAPALGRRRSLGWKPARIWAHPRAKALQRPGDLTEERAARWFGEQSSTCDRGDRVELESLVLEVMGELVELIGDLRDPGPGVRVQLRTSAA